MKNPNNKYYKIPTPIGVISKSQYIPNPKNLVVLVLFEFGISRSCEFGSIGISTLGFGFLKKRVNKREWCGE